MKIGTITFWNSEDNYGQILQCYALIQFLKWQGHDPFLIKFNNDAKQSTLMRRILNVFKIFFKSPSLFYQKIRFKSQSNKAKKKYVYVNRQFSEFRDKYIPSTEKVYLERELFIDPPEADVYICGSDQIWPSGNPVMYLQFAPQSKKRIAYAASFGGNKPNNLNDVSTFLKTFDYVSLRERSGVELCKELGCNSAELVPDPTLLLYANVYSNLCSNIKVDSEKYILLYLLGNEISVSVDSIFNFAQNNGLKIVYVASQGRVDNFPKIYPTIEEWLSLIKNAAYVITNSYHGTIFSLLFNTPFMTIPLKGLRSKMNVRINDLLEKYGLEERIHSSSLDILFNPINFDTFNISQKSEIDIITNKMAEIIKG